MSIAVIGAGSWGTALAILLAGYGNQVQLVGRDPDAIRKMHNQRENRRYLPGIHFPDTLTPTCDLSQALSGAEQIWLVLPSGALATFLQEYADQLPRDVGYVSASKGFQPGTARRISEMVADTLGPVRFAVLSGPTFAREVAAGAPSAVTVASEDPEFAQAVAHIVHGPRFRAYTTEDVLGVELGGGLKNVLAIAAGVSDGFAFGANARAALITRGLAELIRLGDAMGAHRETFMGMAGLGDLVLTCTDNQSRNRRFGLLLAKGLSKDEALQTIRQSVEGLQAAAEAKRLADRYGVDMPITTAVNHVLFEGWSAKDAVAQLLSRSPRSEGL
ncbi:MAG TPA: NAD(P)-dependent glycerol-3-phosphate dehydrogenase [Halothiobacillus sp.]|nr:NAD(P)-dependent glycerol-3-phosphate dehydrogenase [Halothiobacillus sp.]